VEIYTREMMQLRDVFLYLIYISKAYVIFVTRNTKVSQSCNVKNVIRAAGEVPSRSVQQS
jgi:hypothetical protein